jgi:hypothetical protein
VNKIGALKKRAYAAIEGSLILRPLIDLTSTAYSLASRRPVSVTSVTLELALTRTLAVGNRPVGLGFTVTAVTLCNCSSSVMSNTSVHEYVFA